VFQDSTEVFFAPPIANAILIKAGGNQTFSRESDKWSIKERQLGCGRARFSDNNTGCLIFRFPSGMHFISGKQECVKNHPGTGRVCAGVYCGIGAKYFSVLRCRC